MAGGMPVAAWLLVVAAGLAGELSKPGPFTVVGRVEDNAGGINVNVRELTLFGAIPDKAQVARMVKL